MRASGYDRVAEDWYQEPGWVVNALLDAEPIKGLSWDPSCGGGNIVTTMLIRGLTCIGSDIVDRDAGHRAVDFFDTSETVSNIVTNPPYGVIEPYIRHALSSTTNKVCILARLALLEGIKRQKLLRETPLARVWVSSRRVSMPPGGSGIKASGGTVAYAWFVWDHSHSGPPTVGWL